MLAATLLMSLSLTAMAASGAVEFNAVSVFFNEKQISEANEFFALENGVKVPSVITYTDETGGATTYLPVRRIAELMGVTIGWDIDSGAIDIAGVPTPAKVSPAPMLTPSPTQTPVPTLMPEPPVTVAVYVTKTGEKYHQAGCRYLSRSQISIALTDAKSQGYTPCAACAPPQ